MKAKPNAKTPKMAVASHAHPGLELDSKGRPIPMAERLPEDRRKAHRAARSKKPAASKKKRQG